MTKRVNCVRKRETEKAVQIVHTETGEELWIPLSQVDSMHFDKNGVGYMVISDWIAREKNLG